jgi:ribosome biogenesis GTPase A
MPQRDYQKVVETVIRESDVVLEVLDARFVEETRNKAIEDKTRELNKKLIYVINKSDLVQINKVKEIKKTLRPCAFISAKKHLGTTILRKLILMIANKKEIKVGVVGYPDTGKSSLINALKGKRSARVSPIAGFTKTIQWIRVDKRIMMLDSPGVVPFGEKSALGRLLTVDYNKAEDLDLFAMDLIEISDGKIEKFYGVTSLESSEKILEAIALKFKLLKKGGEPDVVRMARRIIKDWQSGEIL